MTRATRTEKDSLGAREVPADAYYGIQTLRAKENFPVSGLRAHPRLIGAYVSLKKACALANRDLGELEAPIASAIAQAADEALAELAGKPGPLLDNWIVDVYQAGAGTSFNMNTNEVLANRALELLRAKRGDYSVVHPNDHVNKAQSTNDTFPAATHVAVLLQARELAPILRRLEAAFAAKGREWSRVVKSARTHLQDAVPITLGQEFAAYAAALAAARGELERRVDLLRAVALGGTAAGTGTNASKAFRAKAIARLSRITGLALRPPADPRMALQSHQPLSAVSSALKELALEMIRIANDLRLLCSGPTTGFAEIVLPAAQPGSSIMPGKVNPSIPECWNMICFQIVGRDAAVGLATQGGQLDLNVMTPLTAYNLLDSMQLLVNFLPQVERLCVRGIRADPEACRRYFGSSLSLAALLNPKLGYARAAEIFKEALTRKTTIAQIVLERKLLTPAELDSLFDPKTVTGTLD
ncbi:MAG: aspartate ammonia-lyase [Elusimicrobia bacterium]|nr:aspartate ammonia-lyase [Elusimicrobiota bacterium]